MLSMKRISLVVAMTRGNVIGKEGKIPWDLPVERGLFGKLTRNKTVIVGRKTFESMGGALRGRHNIVLSRTEGKIEGVDVCRDFDCALSKAESYRDEVFVIGGSDVYAQAIKIADIIHVSYIKKDHDGDRFFPEFDLSEWSVDERRGFADFEHIVYSRRAQHRR